MKLEQAIEYYSSDESNVPTSQILAWLKELQYLREHRWEGVVFGELPPEEQERLRQAHEDGKTMQARYEGGWRNLATRPTWLEQGAYRVKPEPEIEWVTPTDADCPCRCQVREDSDEEWKDAELRYAGQSAFFVVFADGCTRWYRTHCRINAAQRKEEKA